MSDTDHTNDYPTEVPAEDRPERFTGDDVDPDFAVDANGDAAPASAEGQNPTEAQSTGDGQTESTGDQRDPGTPAGAGEASGADAGLMHDGEAEKPPADFDPADNPSNPDLVN